MKKLLLVCVCLFLVACSQPEPQKVVITTTPLPTYTAYPKPEALPTYTLYPEPDPLPTYTPPKPLPTYTPYPTAEPLPTLEPLPTYPPPPTLEALPTYPPPPTLEALPTYTPYPEPTEPPTSTPEPVAEEPDWRNYITEEEHDWLLAYDRWLEFLIQEIDKAVPLFQVETVVSQKKGATIIRASANAVLDKLLENPAPLGGLWQDSLSTVWDVTWEMQQVTVEAMDSTLKLLDLGKVISGEALTTAIEQFGSVRASMVIMIEQNTEVFDEMGIVR